MLCRRLSLRLGRMIWACCRFRCAWHADRASLFVLWWLLLLLLRWRRRRRKGLGWLLLLLLGLLGLLLLLEVELMLLLLSLLGLSLLGVLLIRLRAALCYKLFKFQQVALVDGLNLTRNSGYLRRGKSEGVCNLWPAIALHDTAVSVKFLDGLK